MKLESPQERLDNIRQQLERDLKDHVVAVVADTERVKCWRCAKPGTWMYGFYVTVIPGFVIIAGDIGEIVFQPTHPDPLDFIKGGDAHYQYGKATSEYREQQSVLPYRVREALAALVFHHRRRRERLPSELIELCRDMRHEKYDPADRNDFYRRLYDIDSDAMDVISSITVPDFGVFYRVYALQWFGRWLAQQASQANHLNSLAPICISSQQAQNFDVEAFRKAAQETIPPGGVVVHTGPNCAGLSRPLDSEGKTV